MYSKIVNPITGRKVSITGRLGRKILRRYLNILSGGAAAHSSNLDGICGSSTGFQKWITDTGMGDLITVVDDDEVVAAARINFSRGKFYVACVHPSRQGEGLGRILVDKVMEEMESREVHKLQFNATIGSKKFWDKMVAEGRASFEGNNIYQLTNNDVEDMDDAQW